MFRAEIKRFYTNKNYKICNSLISNDKNRLSKNIFLAHYTCCKFRSKMACSDFSKYGIWGEGETI